MPDFWIHSLGGQLVLDDLNTTEWKKMIESNRKAYNLGCQGPDFFFYNDFFPWTKDKRGPKIGTMIHEKNTKSLFIEIIDYLKSVQNHENFSILASYFSGFIVHYVIDKHEHPFINARTKNTDEHKKLEMKLDTYFINKYWDKKVHLLSPSTTIDIGKELPTALVEFYKRILSKVYRISLSTNTINDSYNDYKRVFDIFYSPKGYKRFSLNMINAVMPLDISICIYPKEVDNDFLTEKELLEFENVLKDGIFEGVQLIELVISYLKDNIEKSRIEAAIHDISFSGGPTL